MCDKKTVQWFTTSNAVIAVEENFCRFSGCLSSKSVAQQMMGNKD